MMFILGLIVGHYVLADVRTYVNAWRERHKDV